MNHCKRPYYYKYSIFIIAIFIIISCLTTGCTPITEREDYLEKDGFMALITSTELKTAKLIGIIGDANKKEDLVVPAEIDGYKITVISSNRMGSFFDRYKAKKIFIPGNNFYFSGEYILFPRAAKRILLSKDSDSYDRGFYHGEKISVNLETRDKFPYNIGYLYVAKTKLKEFEDKYLPLNEETFFFAANISYFYNFDDAPNDGYYWIDDLDEDQKIQTIPPNPTREGYEFGGWFIDNNCTTAFKFDTYIKGDMELNLYAKWI